MNSDSRKAITVFICVITLIAVACLSAMISIAVNADRREPLGFPGNNTEEASERYQRLDEVYNILMEQYYEELDPDKLIQGAIDGMFYAVDDPYTYYYTPEKMAATNADRVGLYVGIGVEVRIFGDGKI